jgi:hypothetical protein
MAKSLLGEMKKSKKSKTDESTTSTSLVTDLSQDEASKKLFSLLKATNLAVQCVGSDLAIDRFDDTIQNGMLEMGEGVDLTCDVENEIPLDAVHSAPALATSLLDVDR